MMHTLTWILLRLLEDLYGSGGEKTDSIKWAILSYLLGLSGRTTKGFKEAARAMRFLHLPRWICWNSSLAHINEVSCFMAGFLYARD